MEKAVKTSVATGEVPCLCRVCMQYLYLMFININAHTHRHVCIYIHTCTCTHTHMYACIHAYVCRALYVCLCTHVPVMCTFNSHPLHVSSPCKSFADVDAERPSLVYRVVSLLAQALVSCIVGAPLPSLPTPSTFTHLTPPIQV